MADIPNAYKIWRKDTWDSFEDIAFFSLSDKRLIQLWKVVLRRTIHNEKSRLNEIIG